MQAGIDAFVSTCGGRGRRACGCFLTAHVVDNELRSAYVMRIQQVLCTCDRSESESTPILSLTVRVLVWRGGATSKAFGLAISRSRVQILLEATLRNNLRQVV